MNTELLVTLASGQLILVLWQVYKEFKEIKERKQSRNSEQQKRLQQMEEMIFKIYRDNLERRIVKTYDAIDQDSPELKEYLMSIQNDMEVYLKAGGNSTVKDLYLRFMSYVREKKGESYYLLLIIEGQNIH